MRPGQHLHSLTARPLSFKACTFPLIVLGALAAAGTAPAQFTSLARVLYTGSQSTVISTGISSPGGVAHSGGNLIVADTGNNRVVKVANGVTTVLISGTIAGKAVSAPSAVAVDQNLNVYAADSGNGRILKWTSPAGPVTVVATGLTSPSGVAVDDNRNLIVSESGTNEIVYINNAGTKSVLISSSASPGGKTLNGPSGVAISGDGATLYFADTNNNRVVWGTVTGGSFSYGGTLSGLDKPKSVSLPPSGSYSAAPREVFVGVPSVHRVYAEIYNDIDWNTELLVANGTLDPEGIDADGDGHLYIANTANNRITMVSTNAVNFGAVELGKSSAAAVLNFDFTESTTLNSSTPVKVWTDGVLNLDFKSSGGSCTAGKTYAAGANCTVNVDFSPTVPGYWSGAAQLLDNTGNVLVAAYLMGEGLGPQLADGNGGGILAKGISDPTGIVVDRAENIYVADMGTATIYKFAPNGARSVVAAIGDPLALAMDGAGNLYSPIANPEGGWTLYKFTPSSQAVPFPGGAEGVFTSLSSAPTSLFIDNASNVYVTVAGMNRIAISSLTSENGTSGVDNQILPEPGIEFLYLNFSAVADAADQAGNLYFIDDLLEVVWKMNKLGDWSQVSLVDVGQGFSQPSALTVDSVGNLWVSDVGNGTVTEVKVSGALGGAAGGSEPGQVAVAANGDLYVPDLKNGIISKSALSKAPSFSFGTQVGATECCKRLGIANIGNAPLVFPHPASGQNPSLTSPFILGSDTTCPVLTPSSSAASLAPGESCVYAIGFAPTTSGTFTGSLTMTDNNLNGSNVTQTISLKGTAP